MRKCLKSIAGSWGILSAISVSSLLTFFSLPGAYAEVVLVEHGESRAVIVLPAAPQAKEQLAADELVEHIGLMTGAELAVVGEGEVPAGLLPIYLGRAANAELDQLTLAKGRNLSSFTLRVADDRIDIRGIDYAHATLDPDPRDRGEGTLFGVYEFLEQLGFRWFIPGDLGRVIPEGDGLSIRIQTETQVPSMDLRLLQPWTGARSGWIARQRLGGERRSTGAHNLPGEIPRGKDGAQTCESGHYAPGAFEAVVSALRNRYEPTENKFYVAMGPRDAARYCKCEGCKALDQGVFDPFYSAVSMTDRYIWFFNKVLDQMEDDYPNMHIVWYVYARHMMPPAIKPNPRIVGVFAPISQCRIRSMDNPMSPDRHVLRWIMDKWFETDPPELYYRGYYNFLACVQLPKTQIDRVRNDIPAFHDRNINVMRVECIRQSWASDPLTLYLAGRLMWDVEADLDMLLEDFYEKFYGPASDLMRKYHQGLESAFADTPYFTGGSYSYFPIFKTHPRRDELRGYLQAATALLEDGDEETIYSERLWAIRRGYERMDLFLDMIKARNRFDFATAYAKMEQYDTLTEELVDYNLEPDIGTGSNRGLRLVDLSESQNRGANSYFNRFFREPVVSGHARAVEKGEIVATLPDEWDFLIDPAEIGRISGYHRPGELGGNWQPMKTSSRSWSDQGLHYYKGVACYRTSVNIPEAYEGRPLYLWFGGVDELAHVWINGEFVGTSRKPEEGLPGVPGSFRSFDMPATGLVNYGEKNWVAVKIENRRIAEIGTGGILAPVMFWSPHDPGWTPGN